MRRTNDRSLIVVTCPRCEYTYDVTQQDVIRGTWRRCPVCQPSTVTLLTPQQLIERAEADGDEAA